MNNYKWNILRHVDGVYVLTGYEFIRGEWSQDGASVRWTYLEAVLEHIRKQEQLRIEMESK